MLWSVRATLITTLEKISVKSMLDLSLCETIGVKVNYSPTKDITISWTKPPDEYLKQNVGGSCDPKTKRS